MAHWVAENSLVGIFYWGKNCAGGTCSWAGVSPEVFLHEEEVLGKAAGC